MMCEPKSQTACNITTEHLQGNIFLVNKEGQILVLPIELASIKLLCLRIDVNAKRRKEIDES